MAEASAACVAAALLGTAAYVNSFRGNFDEGTGITVLDKDLVFAFAFNPTATPPSTAASWTFLQSETRSTISVSLGFRKATANGQFTTTGVWAGATRVLWLQYRPTNCVLDVRGTPVKGNGTGTALVLPGLVAPLPESWGINFVAQNANVSYLSGVTATVRQGPAGTLRLGGLDSNGPVGAGFPAQNITADITTQGYCAITAEMTLT